MAQPGIKELLEAGVHFGHQTRRWNPKMRRFIHGERDGIYIIDLLKTKRLLDQASEFAGSVAHRGGTVLFVGTKKQARDAIREVADATGMPYVNHRWLGGLLTNFQTMSERIRRLHDLERYESEGQLELLPTVSFLEGRPASASVFALESSLLLVLPRSALEDKLRVDLEFAARFYRSLAVLNSKRLRERVTPLGLSSRDGAQVPSAATTVGKALPAAIEEAKQFLVHADAEALKNDNVVPASMVDRISVSFRELLVLANAAIGDASTETDAFKSELGARLRLEFLPYVLLTQTAERFYSKPRGYAGDFFTIEMIYQNRPGGTGRLGALFDECFLKTPPAKAVQNRRGLLCDEILRVVRDQGGSARVTSLACGPAEEIFDTFAQLADRNAFKATLIDIDLQALAFVADKRDKAKLQNHIELLNGNLVYIAMGRQKMELKEQDLIYSIGLIDYFNDKFVIKLLNWVHGHLRPGGKVILGNFHPNNTSKAFMDYVLDWKLIHRTEEDMNRLFESSAFQSPCTAIRFEAEGVNLFAEGIKG